MWGLRLWSQSYKNSETCPNNEDRDNSRNPINTQKHVIFARTAIMVAIFKNRVTVLRNRAFLLGLRSWSWPSEIRYQQSAFSKRSAFFEMIIARHLHLSLLRSSSALDMPAHLVSLKKEVVEENKIINLNFFFKLWFDIRGYSEIS